MVSSPITSWQINGETIETVRDFIFWGSKITADGDRNHKMEERLLLGRKAVTNLDSIFQSRDVSLSMTVHLVKAMVFPVVTYGCESWTTMKAKHWRPWCFWTVLLKKTLESPLECKIKPVYCKGNQVLNIHFKGWCWNQSSNTLATWYEELTHWKRSWCWERLKAGGEEDNKGWDSWMASWTGWTWIWASSRNRWWKPGMLQLWVPKELEMTEQQNWTSELN